MITRLVAICYGTDPLYRLELFGSVLSAISLSDDWRENLEITVFTDQESLDLPFPINTLSISNALEKNRTGTPAVAHLVKTFCLQESLELYQEPIIYFDTDILFKAPPRQLLEYVSPTDVLMNAHEGLLEVHPDWKKLSEYMESDQFQGHLSRKSPMYNSGIVGICPEHMPDLEKAVELARELYQVDPVFNVEQFTTGVSLAERSTVHTCEEEIHHYWGWERKFIHIELARFRERFADLSGDELIKAYQKSPVRRDPDIHVLDRARTKARAVMGGWSADYRFAYLCYLSSIRASKSDPEIANAWAQSAVDALTWAAFFNDKRETMTVARKDFSRYVDITPGWFDERVASAVEELFSP